MRSRRNWSLTAKIARAAAARRARCRCRGPAISRSSSLAGIGGKPLQTVGRELQARLQGDGRLVVGDRLLGAPLRFLDLALGPQHLGTVGIELLGRLGILDADVGLPAQLVDDGAVGEGDAGARIELDGAVEVGERLLVGLRDAVGEAARCKAARRARIERRRRA